MRTTAWSPFIELVLANKISQLVIVYAALPFGSFLITRNIQHVAWGVGVLVAPFVAELIKQGTVALGIWPVAIWCRRPAAASDCDTWNRNGDQGGAPGFPSGHVATAAAFWMGAWLLTPAIWQPGVAVLGVIAVMSMAWARLKKRCHTAFQTMSGALLGSGIAYMALATLI